MKKFAIAMFIAGVALIGFAPAAMATKPVGDDNFHKVTICHNVGHNGHAISVDVAAVGVTDVKGGHGVITFDENGDFVSFAPHAGNGGHDLDFYLHNGAEKDGDDDLCKPVDETTTTTAPPVTTTTEPPVVTTTTQPPVTTTTAPVVTTTTAPVVTTTTQAPVVTTTAPPASDTPAPVAAPVAAPVPAPTGDLPTTGSPSSFIAMIGAGLALIGISFKLLAKKAVS